MDNSKITFHITNGEWPLKIKIYQDFFKELGYIESKNIEESGFIVLPGGADLGKRKNRDSYELEVLDKYLGKKPILGICRGLQLFLFYKNYKIINHIPDFSSELLHTTIDGSYLSNSSWHYTKSGLFVNSRHHQGYYSNDLNRNDFFFIDETRDGIVETIINRDFFGVQWHPELIDKSEKTYIWFSEKLKKFLYAFNTF